MIIYILTTWQSLRCRKAYLYKYWFIIKWKEYRIFGIRIIYLKNLSLLLQKWFILLPIDEVHLEKQKSEYEVMTFFLFWKNRTFFFLYSNMMRIILIFLVVSSLSAYYIGKMPPRPIARSYLPHKTTCDYSIQRPQRNFNPNAYRRYQKYDCN